MTKKKIPKGFKKFESGVSKRSAKIIAEREARGQNFGVRFMDVLIINDGINDAKYGASYDMYLRKAKNQTKRGKIIWRRS